MEDTKQEGVVRMTTETTAEPSAQQGPHGFRLILAKKRAVAEFTEPDFLADIARHLERIANALTVLAAGHQIKIDDRLYG